MTNTTEIPEITNKTTKDNRISTYALLIGIGLAGVLFIALGLKLKIYLKHRFATSRQNHRIRRCTNQQRRRSHATGYGQHRIDTPPATRNQTGLNNPTFDEKPPAYEDVVKNI